LLFLEHIARKLFDLPSTKSSLFFLWKIV
jgi:hypothetical protein